MKKGLGISIGVVVLGAAAIVGANLYAAKQISASISSYNARTKDTQITGEVSANLLTSTVVIDGLTVTKSDGTTTTGNLHVKGVNFFDKKQRLRDEFTLSYDDLTTTESARSAKYAIDGFVSIKSKEGKIGFESENDIYLKTDSKDHFKISLKGDLKNTQDLYSQLVGIISTPKDQRDGAFKQASFGLYLKLMQAQVGGASVQLDNSGLLQETIKGDIAAEYPTATADEVEGEYQRRLGKIRSGFEGPNEQVFDNFFKQKEGHMEISVISKKPISLLEATFKSRGGSRPNSLVDYYDVVLKN